MSNGYRTCRRWKLQKGKVRKQGVQSAMDHTGVLYLQWRRLVRDDIRTESEE